jgi:signal transduction histidine kinase
MLDLHERDRELLAFELHDGFAQLLTGAMMNVQAAAERQPSAPDQSQASLQEAIRLLRESIDESRRLIQGLRPPVLEQFGVIAAVEHLVDESQAMGGPEIEFISKGRFQRVARPLETAVFRIVQETLTNARKHSGSHRVRVELSRAEDHLLIHVEDWGVGFEAEKIREGRFGIRGVRERARLLGGHAEIRSAPGEGTSITVRLPLVSRAQGGGTHEAG